MGIDKDIYDAICGGEGADNRAEFGGILGGSGGRVTRFSFIKGKPGTDFGSYVPDTAEMNDKIALWIGGGLDFMGIFHSHPFCARDLSKKDRDYIGRIMRALPEEFVSLYFPLVFPGSGMKGYRAVKDLSGIAIVDDDIGPDA